jgi:pimeloyl-ACP methyl ester carboxylesterase
MPHQIRTFAHGGMTLSYEVHGTGDRTLVYLHGLLMDAAVNRRLATDLAAADNRVVLLDLPGHGASDKPLLASAHRMDSYAESVVALLDHLSVDRAVVGGVSLGADVSLQVAVAAPERVVGLVLEMPVLERATPFAAMLFTPILIGAHFIRPVLRATSKAFRRVPRHLLGPLDHGFGVLTLGPDELVAVLHGILVGPVAPTADQRGAIDAPALVIGHDADRLHPFGDARRLSQQLPNAHLVEARSILELRLRPARLTGFIAGWLDDVWRIEAERSRRSA